VGLLSASEVGARIRKARRKRKLTQQQLAKRIGRPQSCVSLYERGLSSPSIEVREQIALALALPPESLVLSRRAS
jgi:transcriptional regulator with XRE-family HTH domain